MSILSGIKNKMKAMLSSPQEVSNLPQPNGSGGFISPKATVTACELHGNISIGDHARLKGAYISGEVRIGKNSSLWGPNIFIYSKLNPVVIGNFCSIASNVVMQEFNHIHDRCSSYFIFQNVFGESMEKDINSKGKIEIENDVWIGAHTVIVSGVKIGNGAVIGANSVVSSDIPPYAIAVGSPAKVIRYRFDETVIAKLQEIQWWNWDHERIKRNRSLFEGKMTLEKLNSIGH